MLPNFPPEDGQALFDAIEEEAEGQAEEVEERSTIGSENDIASKPIQI